MVNTRHATNTGLKTLCGCCLVNQCNYKVQLRVSSEVFLIPKEW